jgi:ribosomal protein S18 acetylase RimI-like enzyme
MTVSFRTNVATVDQLSDHLRRCDDSYVPPLGDRVTIDEYARKIAERATRFEAWSDGGLVGLVAAYLPNATGDPVFITDVSVVPELRGEGVASALLGEAIAFARVHAVPNLRLEVDRRNGPAIGLYEASGFALIRQAGETLTMERATKASGLD